MKQLQKGGPKRIDANPRDVERGLVKLVLALVGLVRKLLEKQAMKRVDAGTLTEEEIEKNWTSPNEVGR